MPFNPATFARDAFELDTSRIRDISPEVLDKHGRLRVLPSAYWASITQDERALFGNRYGLYSFPTVELVEYLRGVIAGRSAIEIGAGHGVLAEALGVTATDSRQQEDDYWRTVLTRMRQPPVPYGPNVIKCHASRAVRQFKPEVVVACWVTHKYDPQRHEAGGNVEGIDELDVLRHCDTYVFIGNEKVHQHSRLWSRPHTIEYPPYVYSRSRNGTRDFVAVWQKRATLKRGQV